MKILSVDEEVKELFLKYSKSGIVPERYENDILYIAVAVVNEIDILLSWNFRHIVKLKTKRKINGINLIEGYKTIEISSPREVTGDEI